MNSRELKHLLNAASSSPAGAPTGLAKRVWERIEQGWDPEWIEWQRWVKRLAPWGGALILLVTFASAFMPHGSHRDMHPPALSLFAQPAVEFETSSRTP